MFLDNILNWNLDKNKKINYLKNLFYLNVNRIVWIDNLNKDFIKAVENNIKYWDDNMKVYRIISKLYNEYKNEKIISWEEIKKFFE